MAEKLDVARGENREMTMRLKKYPHLSTWVARYASLPGRIAPDAAKSTEVKAAIEALNDLSELLRRGDDQALDELLKMRERDEWVRRHSPKDDSKDEFYDLPQTD